jgi:hypothetical protein
VQVASLDQAIVARVDGRRVELDAGSADLVYFLDPTPPPAILTIIEKQPHHLAVRLADDFGGEVYVWSAGSVAKIFPPP